MNTMDNRHASAKAENPDSRYQTAQQRKTFDGHFGYTGKRACQHALKEGASQRVSIRLVPTLFLAYSIDLGCCAFQRQVDISMDVGKSVKIKQTMGFARSLERELTFSPPQHLARSGKVGKSVFCTCCRVWEALFKIVSRVFSIDLYAVCYQQQTKTGF
jgi:hypothetical protein